jgi:hypothetical protein
VAFSLFNTAHGPGGTRVTCCWIEQQVLSSKTDPDPIEMTVIDRALCAVDLALRRPPASMLGDAADGATAPPTLPSSGGAPPSLAGAKKSLGGTGSPSKCLKIHRGG